MQIPCELAADSGAGFADRLGLNGGPETNVARSKFLSAGRLVGSDLLARPRLDTDRPGPLVRRTLLVRSAEQVHRHSFRRQTTREESRGRIERLIGGWCDCGTFFPASGTENELEKRVWTGGGHELENVFNMERVWHRLVSKSTESQLKES